MRLFQVAAGIRKDSGGPSYTIPSLCTYLKKIGADVELNILSGDDSKLDFEFKTVVHKRLPPTKLGVSPQMKNYLMGQVKEGDIIHSNGLWMMPNIYPKFIANKVGAKFVLSPHGMLTDWSLNRSRIIKKIVGYLGQYNAIFNADCIQVAAESEYDDVRRFGYKGPITVIPNGVDIPDRSILSNHKGEGCKKIIFISRVHPKKGIELLLEAWSKIGDFHPDWELEICGPGDLSYVNKIKQEIDNITCGRVRYVSPVYNEEKDDFYNSASLFVLPTYSENFGVVVAEALSYEVPVIVSKGAPWQSVVDKNCGWWINNTVDELINTLNDVLQLSSKDLVTLGRNGRQWMEDDFSWDEISKNMLTTYFWLNNKADKPDFIRLN